MKKTPLLPLLLLFCFLANGQKFAAIGDYGVDNENEAAVADLVSSWNPEFIITVGDNNYPSGEAATIDQNIGKYYSDYIFPYQGVYGSGASTNRFFPVAGNHDYYVNGATPYYDYFELPGNERYYDFVEGNIHFFGINSNGQEPDGISETSTQAQWLKSKLENSTARWKIVYLHHAPFSSGNHGSNQVVQWPFADWGATAVLAGHDHHYERLQVDGIPYFVIGTGGKNLYSFNKRIFESQAIHRSYGALLIEANANTIDFQFWSSDNVLIDSYLQKVTNRITIKKSILNKNDDVEENETNGEIYAQSPDLELGFDNFNYQNYQTIGLRYNSMNIPQGAVIRTAYLEFSVEGINLGNCVINIRGEKAANSAPFDVNMPYNVSNRNKTNKRVNWSPEAWTTIGEKKYSPDLSDIVQEIIDQPGWSAYNSITMILKGSVGTRQGETFEGSTGQATKLVVEYELPFKTIFAQISNGNNDVEENETNGKIYTHSPDIELGFDDFNNQNYQTVGLRYENINIPQGAIINEAYLEFTVEDVSLGVCNVSIKGEKTVNSAPFDIDKPYNITSRATTNNRKNWLIEAWSISGEKKQSPDLSTIVQEIVNQSDWSANNALSMIIKGNIGTREAISYEGNSNQAAKLVIKYQEPIYSRLEPLNQENTTPYLSEKSSYSDVAIANVFPNPVKVGTPITIALKKDIAAEGLIEVCMYTVNGTLVATHQFTKEKTTINRINIPTFHLNSGSYFLLMKSKNWKKTYPVYIIQ